MNKQLIKESINDAISKGVVCNISAAFIEKDHTEYYIVGKMGKVEPFDQIDVTSDMQYDMASCTKVICTTTRLFQLIEQNKLSLEDYVCDYLPSFTGKDVKIKHLLLHNAGLPSDMENKDTLTEDNIVERIYGTKLLHKPEEATAYSDVGFILLGFIIAKIDNCDLNTTYLNNVLKPLHMDHSGYHPLDKDKCIPTEIDQKRGLIHGVGHDRKGYLLKDICGSAGLFSTIEDVNKFVRSYLFKENSLLSDETVKLMLETDIGARSYGWDKKYHKHILYHTGFTGTSIMMDFDENYGLVMLTNRVHPTRNNQAYIDWRNELNDKLVNGE